MRLDRLISLGLVDPFLRMAGRRDFPPDERSPNPRRLPVLMYHRIADDPEPGISPYYRVCTSPARFAEQMQWLADWGYRGVTLSEGLQALKAQGEGSKVQDMKEEVRFANGAGTQTPSYGLQTPVSSLPSSFPLPPGPASPSAKLVAITFDDGFRDFHTAAFPVLQRHGFTATMYLPTAYVGETRLNFKSHECLTWPEVRELQRAGIEFGSHTVNHPILVRLNWPEIERELHDSRHMIEQRLGTGVSSFAYPYAFPSADRDFTARLREIISQTGYATCATTEIGTVTASDDPLQLRRLPAHACDDFPLLRAKVSGAYDWLHAAQSVFKRFKPRLARPAA